jgi:hypothetical protein
VQTWEDQAVFYRSVRDLYNRIFGALGLIIGVIVVFVVGNAMAMAIIERTREVGTLRALGTLPGQLVRSFALEGLLLGGVGRAGRPAGPGVTLALLVFPVQMPPPPGRSVGYPLQITADRSSTLLTLLAMLALATLASALVARRTVASAGGRRAGPCLTSSSTNPCDTMPHEQALDPGRPAAALAAPCAADDVASCCRPPTATAPAPTRCRSRPRSPCRDATAGREGTPLHRVHPVAAALAGADALAAEAGQKVLMLGDDFWLLMPGSQRPLRITPSQKLLGDASTGDIATLSWADDYGGSWSAKRACRHPKASSAALPAPQPAGQPQGRELPRIELWLGKARHEPLARRAVRAVRQAGQARALRDGQGPPPPRGSTRCCCRTAGQPQADARALPVAHPGRCPTPG